MVEGQIFFIVRFYLRKVVETFLSQISLLEGLRSKKCFMGHRGYNKRIVRDFGASSW
jgi:hypothetical protein